jgi:hypothetical protein
VDRVDPYLDQKVLVAPCLLIASEPSVARRRVAGACMTGFSEQWRESGLDTDGGVG